MAYDNNPQNLLQRAVGGGLVHTPKERVPWISPQQREQNDLQSSLDEFNSRGPVFVRSKARHNTELINDDLDQWGTSFSSFYYPETETGNMSDIFYDYKNDDLRNISRMDIGTGDEKMVYNDEIYDVQQIPGTDRYAYPKDMPGEDIYNTYYHGPPEEGQDPYSMVYGTSSSQDLWDHHFPDDGTSLTSVPKTYDQYMSGEYSGQDFKLGVRGY